MFPSLMLIVLFALTNLLGGIHAVRAKIEGHSKIASTVSETVEQEVEGLGKVASAVSDTVELEVEGAHPFDYARLNNMLSRFARMVDRSINVPNNGLTVAQLGSFLTADCVWEFGGAHAKKSEGIAEIAKNFNEFHSKFQAGVHHYTNRVIDVDTAGRSGKLFWYSDAVWMRKEDGQFGSGQRWTFAGNYDADIVYINGNWKIKKVMTTPLVQ